MHACFQTTLDEITVTPHSCELGHPVLVPPGNCSRHTKRTWPSVTECAAWAAASKQGRDVRSELEDLQRPVLWVQAECQSAALNSVWRGYDSSHPAQEQRCCAAAHAQRSVCSAGVIRCAGTAPRVAAGPEPPHPRILLAGSEVVSKQREHRKEAAQKLSQTAGWWAMELTKAQRLPLRIC